MSQAQVFESFNEQLACIANAGVPLDEGLRLIAQDMRSRRGRRAVERVIADLESGHDLSSAFARQAGSFPELYHQVLEVGVRSGRMSNVLIAFGRHLALIQRLKSQLWRSLSYPIVCLVMLLGVATFLAVGPVAVLGSMALEIKPETFSFRRMGSASSPSGSYMPLNIIMAIAPLVPWVCGAILLLLILAPVMWFVLGRLHLQSRATDMVLFRIPLLGPVLRTSAMARWCDALAICTDAGMDLPAALQLSGRLVGYPSFHSDSRDMASALASGLTLRVGRETRWRQITPSTRMALQLASERQDLPTTSKTLAEMYQQQAERRALALGAILSPIMLLTIGALIAITLGAVLLPLVQILRAFA